MQVTLRLGRVAFAVVSVVVAAACSSSSIFDETWSAPDAPTLRIERGTKVIGMVVTADVEKQRDWEAALVSALDEKGLQAVGALSVVPEEAAKDAEKARPHIRKSEARYALVITVASGPASRRFYGPNLSGQNFGWAAQDAARPSSRRTVQTRVYDLPADALVWSGDSRPMDPSRADSFMTLLVRTVGDELQGAGLLGP
jgi:membrane-associated protease RseP (regulator of RpoE activity)